jgi:hypothetical protein
MPFAARPFPDECDKCHILRAIVGCEPWHRRAEVAPLEARILVNGASQKGHGERAPAYKADSQLFTNRQAVLEPGG